MNNEIEYDFQSELIRDEVTQILDEHFMSFSEFEIEPNHELIDYIRHVSGIRPRRYDPDQEHIRLRVQEKITNMVQSQERSIWINYQEIHYMASIIMDSLRNTPYGLPIEGFSKRRDVVEPIYTRFYGMREIIYHVVDQNPEDNEWMNLLERFDEIIERIRLVLGNGGDK